MQPLIHVVHTGAICQVPAPHMTQLQLLHQNVKDGGLATSLQWHVQLKRQSCISTSPSVPRPLHPTSMPVRFVRLSPNKKKSMSGLDKFRRDYMPSETGNRACTRHSRSCKMQCSSLPRNGTSDSMHALAPHIHLLQDYLGVSLQAQAAHSYPVQHWCPSNHVNQSYKATASHPVAE